MTTLPRSGNRFLELGPNRHDWVENFLTSWFMEGVARPETVSQFTATWKAMIEYTQTSPVWAETSGKATFDVSKLWIELLGLGWGARVIQGEEFKNAVTELIPYYREWADRWLGYRDTVPSFTYFLRQPAASELLPEGIKWLYDVAQNYSDKDWQGRPKEADALVNLVEHWWKTRRDTSFGEQELAAATGLLKLLSDRQHPRASSSRIRWRE